MKLMLTINKVYVKIVLETKKKKTIHRRKQKNEKSFRCCSWNNFIIVYILDGMDAASCVLFHWKIIPLFWNLILTYIK